MNAANGPRAVTFDFWNTIMWEEPGSLKRERLAVWDRSLGERGIDPGSAELERAHDAAHVAYEEAWRAGRQFTVTDAAPMLVAALGLPRGEEWLLLDGYDEAGRLAAVHPCDGAAECLTRCRDAGRRLAIVCDIGLTPSPVVRELLDREGLLDLFDDTTFSDEVGHYKPSAAIFEHALAQVGGIAPGDAAHVGDRRRTDVGGARALGMTSVRYNGIYEDPPDGSPEADLVVDRLDRLADLLEGGGAR